MSTKVFRYCVVFMALAVGVWGCSDGKNANDPASEETAASVAKLTPEETAEAFMSGAKSGDQEGVKELLTEKARAALDSGDSGMSITENAFEVYTVGETTISDGGAVVALEVTEDGEPQKMKLKMREEAGAWRIYAMTLVLGEGMEMTVNLEALDDMLSSFAEGISESLGEGFESAMQSAMMGGTEEDIAAKKVGYDAIRGLMREDYESGWRNANKFQGAKAVDALTELASELGLTIHASDLEGVGDTNVDATVLGLSRLEAIDAIGRDLGYYPVFPDHRESMGAFGNAMMGAFGEGLEAIFGGEDSAIQISGVDDETAPEEEVAANAIRFSAGSRPYPIVFTGPFAIEIDALEENAPLPTGQISLSVKGYGLDAGVATLLGNTMGTLQFDGLVDAKGRSLVEEGVHYMSNGDVKGTSYVDSYSLELFRLIREVTEIDRFAGIQNLGLPLEVHEVSFEGIEAGQVRTVGELTLTVKNTGEYTQFEISGPEAITEVLDVQFWPLDGDGKSLGITYSSADSWQSGKVQAGLNTSAAPHTVSLKLVTKFEVIENPFEFRDIALEKYAETSVRIEELAFDGRDAPLTVSLKEITERDPNFSKVDIEIVNHSNKDAEKASVNFEYLDSSGAILKDFPHMVTGTFSTDGWQPIALKGETSEQETTAFGMPEDVDTIRMIVQEVTFTDGTSWSVH